MIVFYQYTLKYIYRTIIQINLTVILVNRGGRINVSYVKKHNKLRKLPYKYFCIPCIFQMNNREHVIWETL